MSPYEPLRRVRRTVRAVGAVIRRPPRWSPGHYYSPLTTSEDAERATRWIDLGRDPAGVHLDHGAMGDLARVLAPMWTDVLESHRYHATQMYAASDAAIYHSMLRHFRPKRVLEVGSGFSTAVALDTIGSHRLRTRITCIEPHTDRLHSLLGPDDDIELLEMPVQEAPLDVFDALGPGDFLFIDSTHVAKAGSDVVWLFLHVLPTLAPGVIVHVHDIFWPLEYDPTWLSVRQDWNEIYLVHAFLSGNRDWDVLLFSDLVWLRHTDLVRRFAPTLAGEHPGGLWLQKRS